MPQRSNEEVLADWFRIISAELTDVINSTESTPDSVHASDEYVTRLIHLLADQVLHDENVAVVPVPCCIEVWTKSPDAPD